MIALLAIYPTTQWPDVAGMVGFLCVTIFVNGPLAPLLPATYEPILAATGRFYPPLLVALVGIAGTLYIEYINYYLYRAALIHPRLEGARTHPSVRAASGFRLVRWTVGFFRRSPFFCVWLCAWSPLPYWAVRFLAPFTGYPVRPYLFATFLGRAPRLWAYAALGLILPIPTWLLLAAPVLMIAVGVLVATAQSRTVPLKHRYAELRN